MGTGMVKAEDSDSGKLYSFIDDESGLWYVPFVYVTTDGFERLQTQDNPVYDTVTFVRNSGDPGMTQEAPADVTPILGTWYEENVASGRIINVYEDGTYIADFRMGTSSEGVIRVETLNYGTFYNFYDNERGFWYSFEETGKGADQRLYTEDTDLELSVSFGRTSTTDSASGAINKITGTWIPNGPAMDFTITVYDDCTYLFNNSDGSSSMGVIEINVVDGVEK